MKQEVIGVLASKFKIQQVKALLKHFNDARTFYSRRDWEHAISKTGKFVEVVLKCIHYFTTGNYITTVNVGKEIDRLQGLPKQSFDSTFRLLIPRVCRVIYAIASNRGARHDKSDFDPNPMDASLSVTNMSWILAELVRYFHPGQLSATAAKDIVDSLVERKMPLIETVDGLTYIHKKGIKPREILLLRLTMIYPKRLTRQQLVDTVEAHGFSKQNARTTLNLLKKNLYVHENQNNELRLLQPGLIEAEDIMKE